MVPGSVQVGMNAAHEVATLLRRQAGVVSRAQALASGLSPDVVDRRVATRAWVPQQPRVYRDRTHPANATARVWAAVLWAGEDAVLSGAAAAWWHGLAPAPADADPVTVTVPRRRSPRPRPGIAVRRRDLPPRDRDRVRGLAVTGPALSALEAGVEKGGAFLDAALRAGADLEAVTQAYARNLGSHGSAGGHTLLVATARRSGLAARHRLVRALRAARVGGWRTDHPALGIVVELAFPQARIAIEVRDPTRGLDDGRQARQAWRHAVLARAGWRVLCYSADDPPGAVLAAIAASARRAS